MQTETASMPMTTTRYESFIFMYLQPRVINKTETKRKTKDLKARNRPLRNASDKIFILHQKNYGGKTIAFQFIAWHIRTANSL